MPIQKSDESERDPAVSLNATLGSNGHEAAPSLTDRVYVNVISYNARFSTCEESQKGQLALRLLQGMRSYSTLRV